MPGHPAADAQGFVRLPNVDLVVETADMREANRSYEANLQAIKQAREMITMTLDLLRIDMIDAVIALALGMRAPVAVGRRGRRPPLAGCQQARRPSRRGFRGDAARSSPSQRAQAWCRNAETTSVAGIQGSASVQQVVEAVMSAEQTLQAAVAIRDKVVAAYLEISRMADLRNAT